MAPIDPDGPASKSVTQEGAYHLYVAIRDAIAHWIWVASRATPGPWVHHVDGDDDYRGCGMVFTLGEDVVGGEIAAPAGDLYPRGGYDPYGDMAFIAANNPHAVMKRLDRDLRLLERHQPCACVPESPKVHHHLRNEPCNDPRRRWIPDEVFGSSGEGHFACITHLPAPTPPDVHCATHHCGPWPCIETVEVAGGYGVEIDAI